MRKLPNSELNRLSVPEFIDVVKLPVWIVLDNVRSQNNTGSVFRTADAFRMGGICLCGITATPPHREIHKTALGAEDSVEWKYFTTTPEALEYLKNQGFMLIAIEQAEGSVSLEKFVFPQKKGLALVFGNEISGVSDEVMQKMDACIEIPQFGTKHSINIAVSAGIVIWEVFNKLGGFSLSH
ncbi:MAG: RNA methyltransferase [Bacteroidetes bacterium]|nr:RNA methyltransferase [Bacteroidota bacterium]